MDLKTLALELGLSQTTVSRALNGYPEVNEATRRRVEAAARLHNYRPNSRAKGLATGRAMMIGQIIPASTQHEMVNPIFGDFVSGASHTFSQHGYDVMISRVSDMNEGDVYREYRARRAVDGVILQGPTVDDPRISLLNEIGLPFIVHGRSSKVTEPYDWVDVSNRRSYAHAMRFLTDFGHRRIALINGLEHMDFAHRRRAGYLDGLAAVGIEPDPALMRSDEMTEHFGCEQTRELLRLDDPPTAILVSSMIAAIGVRRAIQESGLVLGRDVSVITFDDDLSYLKNGQDIPIFTATRSSVRHAGEILAQLLIARIADPDAAQQTRLLKADLVVGRSTGPAPQRS